MSDYGQPLELGVFLTPVHHPAQRPVELAVIAERAGLDLVTVQDHPYQPSFQDTWTLLSYLAARTDRVRLAANVTNLPLRPPAVLARSVATLDLLSGGRVELGLGAGAFWDAIEAMGGPRRTPGESVAALAEAIEVIRGLWDTQDRSRLQVDGRHYRLAGAKRGPAPSHPVGIWVGAYRPRILRLVGRLADGWLPSLGHLPGGIAGLDAMSRVVDEAAVEAGRDPAAIRRLLNIEGRFGTARGFLRGDAAQWAEQLAEIALTHGTSTFVLATDDAATIERYAAEVAPALRERVAEARA